jgi:hypothetical protein
VLRVVRLLGEQLGIGDATVARARRRHHVQPWRSETFCGDEKSQIQALNRTAPILPPRPGLPEKATHGY